MESAISVTPLVAAVTELYVRGEPPGNIAHETGFPRKRVEQCLERLESMLLLVTHGFPRHLIPRVLAWSPEEVQTYLDAIDDELGDPAKAAEFVRRRILSAQQGPASPQEAPKPTAGPALDGSQAEALDVLDFWASKWL